MSQPAPLSLAAESRTVQFTAFGGPEVLQVVSTAPPEPGPGEVRVCVEASSVQFTDTLIRRGVYPDFHDDLPATPGYDLVGHVDAVGEGVTDWVIGDRVADLCQWGGNARFVVRPAEALVRVPEGVDAAEAASLVLSWQTAQQALFTIGGLTAGQRVLMIGGNGAVGQAAITLAVLAGAEVYTTAREVHHDALRAMGAHPLPRDGVAQARDMDLVIDGVGAGGFGPAYRTLRRGGMLVAIGVSAAMAQGGGKGAMFVHGMGLAWRYLWPDGRRVRFYSIATRRKRDPQGFRADLEDLLAKLAHGVIRPEIAERLTLDDVADAHARLEAGGLRGKLVVDPWA